MSVEHITYAAPKQREPVPPLLQIGKPPELQSPEQSIFESYSPLNDAERLQKLTELSPEKQRYYLEENMISYLEEFAGEIPVKKLTGILKDDGTLEILGTNVSDMYNHAADIAGPGSREWMEGQGLDKMMNGLRAGNNRAIWISPPKLADYGFAFTFIADAYDANIGGRPLRELLIRYDEPRETISYSQQLYNLMSERIGSDVPDSRTFGTANDFLAHPLVYQNTGFEEMDTLYDAIGVSAKDIEHSERFRQELFPRIKPWLQAYTGLVQEMSTLNLQTDVDQLELLNNKGKTLIGAMFNTARMVDRQLKSTHENQEQLERDQRQMALFDYDMADDRVLYMLAQQMSGYQRLTVRGSSCPVTQAGRNEQSFITLLNSGLPVATAMEALGLVSSSDTENKWTYTKGKCRINDCNSKGKVVDVGPCNICKACEKKIDAKEQAQIALSELMKKLGVAYYL